MMQTRRINMGTIALVLVLSIALSACGQAGNNNHPGIVAFGELVADPQQFADQYLCTEGVRVDGFEASGLGASTSGKEGALHLVEPVIWLESADLQSRQDCVRAGADSAFEFCQVVVCGVFETGGGYGHGGAYAYQLRGRDLSALPSPQATPTPLPTASPELPVPTPTEQAGAPESSTTPVAPPPTLTVDELPIVAAEVDGPGHLEYTDRLGEQALARIEGLRAFARDQELARSNATLAPFGYRLEARFDAEWNQTFYDLYRGEEAEPVAEGLSRVLPVSVNASGTDFVFAAENAPNASPWYLQVRSDGVRDWEDAEQSSWLPPAYVGDALARVTFTGFPTMTYQVELAGGGSAGGGLVVYSGTAVAQGAYMPLRSFTAWDSHWVLEVDDHLIMDGQDLGEAMGYDAVFGFSLIRGQPFYFYEQDGKVHMSYGGLTLPNSYDQVFHNQCCEAAIHNVETLGDAVLFHALWNGTWYLVEAGVYEGEMAGTYRYTAPEGWSFGYPMHWDRLDEELGLVQDTETGKTVTFASQSTTQAELESWLESEISRKLAGTEAENTLAEPLTSGQEGDLTAYRYAILSRGEASETLLRTTVLFDGQRRYEFYAAMPPVAEEEYEAILDSFRTASPSTGFALPGGGLGTIGPGEKWPGTWPPGRTFRPLATSS